MIFEIVGLWVAFRLLVLCLLLAVWMGCCFVVLWWILLLCLIAGFLIGFRFVWLFVLGR